MLAADVISQHRPISSIAADTLSEILSAPGFLKNWRKHHASRGDKPVQDLAAEFKTHADKLELRPDLAKFGKSLSDLQLNALGPVKPGEAENISVWRTRLNDLSGYLSVICESPGGDLAMQGSEAIQETADAILEMEKKETGQVPFTPVRSTKNFLKSWCGEFWGEIKKHKIASPIVATVIGGTTWLMMNRVPAGRVRLTPEETALTGLMPGEGGSDIVYNPEVQQDMARSCHDHIAQLIGSQPVADKVRDALSFDISGHHFSPLSMDCTGMNKFATNAVNLVNGFSERLRPFTEEPVAGIGQVIPHSHFMQSFIQAAHDAGTHVVMFDKFENLAFHGGLLVSHWLMTHKLATMDMAEIKEKWNAISDFTKRTVQTSYLNYAGALTGAFSYVASGAPEPYVGAFWSAIAGALAGHFSHKAIKSANSHNHVEELLRPARDKLMEFSEAARELTLKSAEMPRPRSFADKFRDARDHVAGMPKRMAETFRALPTNVRVALTAASYGDFATLKAMMPGKTAAIAFTVASAAGLTAIIAADANGALQNPVLIDVSKGAGTGGGYGMVWGLYGGINGPQDMALHIPFAITGGLLGLMTGKAWQGSRYLGNKLFGRTPAAVPDLER